MKKQTIVLIVFGMIFFSIIMNIIHFHLKFDKHELFDDSFEPNQVKWSEATFDTLMAPYGIVFHGLLGVEDSIINETGRLIDVYVQEDIIIDNNIFIPDSKSVDICVKGKYTWINPLNASRSNLDKQETEQFEMNLHLKVLTAYPSPILKKNIYKRASKTIKYSITQSIAKQLNSKSVNSQSTP